MTFKMIKWKKLALGIFTVASTLAYSQQTVTLKQAIEFALQNKADALKARLDITNADAKILEAKAGALPKVTGNANITYNPIIQEIALGGQTFKMGQPWVAVAGVQLQQALFNQQVFIGLKAAKSTKEFYQLNANLTEEQIIERVSNAYFQVFTAQEQKNTLESSYSSTEKVRNVIKSLYDNGLSKK
jgi:outer membrane protein TolC